jgi:hypothetical protein
MRCEAFAPGTAMSGWHSWPMLSWWCCAQRRAKKKWQRAGEHRAECSRTASAGACLAGANSRARAATVVVAFSQEASGRSSALACGAPGPSGSSGVSTAPSAHPAAGPPRAHRRPVGAALSPAPPAEAPDGASGDRSSPDRGGHALDRAHRVFLARIAGALRIVVHGVQPRPSLVQRGHLGTHPPGPASRRSSVRFVRLIRVTVTVVLSTSNHEFVPSLRSSFSTVEDHLIGLACWL